MKILHKDLNFHPYKMAVVQQINDRDMANRSAIAERLIGNLSDDVIILKMDEAQFHLSAVSTDRILAIGQREIHSSSINALFTVHV
jgi:hypothetical protein